MVNMLQVSLPEEMIKLFKLTCRNTIYKTWLPSPFVECNVQEYKKGLRHGESFYYVSLSDGTKYGTVYYKKWKQGRLVSEQESKCEFIRF